VKIRECLVTTDESIKFPIYARAFRRNPLLPLPRNNTIQIIICLYNILLLFARLHGVITARRTSLRSRPVVIRIALLLLYDIPSESKTNRNIRIYIVCWWRRQVLRIFVFLASVIIVVQWTCFEHRLKIW